MPIVVLVDGVGRPKVLDLPDSLVPPIVVEFAHQGITSGPDCRVKFYRTSETDPVGRPVFRQKTGGPAPTIRTGYFVQPPPRLRLEGTTGE